MAAADAGNAARSCGTTTTMQRFRTPRPLSIPGRSRTTRPGGRSTSRCPAFVNTGTVVSEAPGFGMSGATGIAGPVFAITRAPGGGAEGLVRCGRHVRACRGAVINRGGFGIDKSTLEVSGGSLSGNPATDVYYLGAGPATVSFAPLGADPARPAPLTLVSG